MSTVREDLAEALRRIADRAQAVVLDAYQSQCENADLNCPPGFGLLFWQRWEELETALRETKSGAILARHEREPDDRDAAVAQARANAFEEAARIAAAIRARAQEPRL